MNCSRNDLTQLNLECIALQELDCIYNKLTALDLTDMFMLNWITGDNQSVELTLNKNGNGIYSVPIELNTPIFSNSVIQYNGGQIISSDKTVLSTNFDVQTGKIFIQKKLYLCIFKWI